MFVTSALSFFHTNISMFHLKEGDIAPPFEGKIQDGTSITLAQYLGKKVALYFYPKDNTPGCTNQACNLRDNHMALQAQGIEIIGVSPDNLASHVRFSQKHSLPFPLIADVDLQIHNLYGVWGEKKFMGRIYDGVHRTTFMIDETGHISHIIRKVKTKVHSEQILAL